MSIPCTLASIFGGFGFPEFVVVAIIGVLLFGRRLPEVGRNLGRGIVEFKKGLASAGEPIVDQTSGADPSSRVGPGAPQQIAGVQPAATIVATCPDAVSPASADEQLRKQQEEMKRLSVELQDLKEQLARQTAAQKGGQA